ncbi:MAG: hypothetical protein QF441_16240 [Bacteriovoracaceae bacterium]|jgi:hypothetical protein|nr:hypothetical protein [Halobacteriovoraceae bacterium]MDP7322154.1 hypothetical protein [Bacteriovoracaceae bacterium]|tara:strand:+ start:182 stop:367 length:186 start_codon:yes stop_codon:yes gene_type:complete
MDEKERALNIVSKYLKDSNEVLTSVEEFARYEENLPVLIKQVWDSQNEFFNDLAAFLLGEK